MQDIQNTSNPPIVSLGGLEHPSPPLLLCLHHSAQSIDFIYMTGPCHIDMGIFPQAPSSPIPCPLRCHHLQFLVFPQSIISISMSPQAPSSPFPRPLKRHHLHFHIPSGSIISISTFPHTPSSPFPIHVPPHSIISISTSPHTPSPMLCPLRLHHLQFHVPSHSIISMTSVALSYWIP